MADKSPIEWTDATWNPIVGCSIVSPGCTHCYAMRMAGRIEAMGGAKHYAGTTKKVNGKARGGERSEQGSKTVWTGEVAMAPDHILLQPLAWRASRRIFVNSMGDLFHEDVPDEWIDRVFAVMALAPQHTFQVLTKRATRMREYMVTAHRNRTIAATVMDISEALARQAGTHEAKVRLDHFSDCFAGSCPFSNVWLGVSAERQQEADERIPELLATPAAVRFVSAEPLLGPIDFTKITRFPEAPREFLHSLLGRVWTDQTGLPNPDPAWTFPGRPFSDGGRGLDWIIVGGESGPGARPMHPAWARSIRDQCHAAGVSFFFKQWGEWAPQIGAVDGWTIDDDPEISRFDHREWENERWSEPFHPMWCDWQDGNYDEEQCVSRIGKRRAGRLLDGVEHNGMPGPNEVPAL